MALQKQSRVSQCPSECSECPLDAGNAGGASEASEASVFTGGRLALRAAWVFLMPLAAAIAGAAIGTGGGALGQWIGAMGGFALGVAVAAGAARWARKDAVTRKESP